MNRKYYIGLFCFQLFFSVPCLCQNVKSQRILIQGFRRHNPIECDVTIFTHTKERIDYTRVSEFYCCRDCRVTDHVDIHFPRNHKYSGDDYPCVKIPEKVIYLYSTDDIPPPLIEFNKYAISGQ
jgi:hypothetical protein